MNNLEVRKMSKTITIKFIQELLCVKKMLENKGDNTQSNIIDEAINRLKAYDKALNEAIVLPVGIVPDIAYEAGWEKFHRNCCVPSDCHTCDITGICEKQPLLGTWQVCAECGEKFEVTRLLYMDTAHDCRKYHGW